MLVEKQLVVKLAAGGLWLSAGEIQQCTNKLVSGLMGGCHCQIRQIALVTWAILGGSTVIILKLRFS